MALETPVTDAYPTKLVERSIEEALHPKGMSTHSGMVRLSCNHVMLILSRSRQLERKLSAARFALRACVSELPDRCEHQRELARAAADEPLDVEGPDTHFLCR